jgi:hypothetical protein
MDNKGNIKILILLQLLFKVIFFVLVLIFLNVKLLVFLSMEVI